MVDQAQGGMLPLPSGSSPSWAEPESGCGYYIPARADITARNLRIINEAARRLREADDEQRD